MALALQVRIFRKQRLAEGLHRLVVVLHFVSRRAGIELNPIGLPRARDFPAASFGNARRLREISAARISRSRRKRRINCCLKSISTATPAATGTRQSGRERVRRRLAIIDQEARARKTEWRRQAATRNARSAAATSRALMSATFILPKPSLKSCCMVRGPFSRWR